MVFNSLNFLVFASLFFIIWVFIKKEKSLFRWIFITFSSFIFYGWWDWRFLFLLIGSGLVDYFCGLLIPKRSKERTILLVLSLVTNLGLLAVFKYSAFFARIIQAIVSLVIPSFELTVPEFTLILPVGISFYTFQSLSYTIDIYRGRLTPTKNIFHFFSYLAMFPQLVAGPIVRAKDFLKQLETTRETSNIERWNGFKLICFGLFQKMVIADNLSYMVDKAFTGTSNFDGTLYWWLIMIAFAFQIYCDFSGYSLIARGLAKYMGYHFKMNFNHPYLSTSLREFWGRWHISLSTWFRDYVYIPLGGSRNGLFTMVIALFVTMLLSGLWHGANFTFLAWALIHTSFLLVERLTQWNQKIKLPSTVLFPIIFVQVTIAWVYFRAEDIQQANQIIGNMFTLKPVHLDFFTVYFNNLFFLIIAVLIELWVFVKRSNQKLILIYRNHTVDMVIVAFCIVMIFFFRGVGEQFIYFQF